MAARGGNTARRPNLGRRLLVALAGLSGLELVLLQGPRTASASELVLCVFLHTQMNAHSLENLMKSALPGVVVRVFSRAKDFESGLRQNPDAVLSLLPVLQANGHKADVQGLRAGSPTERYVLLSASSVTANSVRAVGAVDLLGRSRMPAFVAKLLNGNAPRVTPVTKLVDLLPLLQFGSVDAVILPERNVPRLKSGTRLKLQVAELPNPLVGLPALAILTPGGRSLRDALLKAGDAVRTEIGVDTWR
jgi:hypothetical protein